MSFVKATPFWTPSNLGAFSFEAEPIIHFNRKPDFHLEHRGRLFEMYYTRQ
jgi:hypothetical protein